jgi:hypothetical protein
MEYGMDLARVTIRICRVRNGGRKIGSKLYVLYSKIFSVYSQVLLSTS